jgi:hypothetical protein
MVTNIAKKGLESCETVNIWAYSVPLMRFLYKEDNLYLDELFLLSLVYQLSMKAGRPITKQEVIDSFPMLSYKRDKMLLNLVNRGFINNLREGPRKHGNGFRLVLSPAGEMLLIKYDKVMRKLCEGEK